MLSRYYKEGEGESLNIFDEMARLGHEQLIFCQDRTAKLKSIIAIHDTTLGPALGGCRMWPYETEEQAIMDALRLSRGMTYKSGAAGENYGGGKSVIIGDPLKDKSEELFRAFGRFIAGFNGRYSTGTDVGTKAEDFVIASKEGKYFGALPEAYGGSGDSSIITAYGVWYGLKALAKQLWGSESLAGRHIAIQGVGKVGYHLIEYLVQEEVKITVCDIYEANVRCVQENFQVSVVSPDEIYDVECDIFSPNALGAIINDETIQRFKCQAIGGAANNQLAVPEKHGKMLQEQGILYAPDYVINAGGLIQVADEIQGYNKERAFTKASRIYAMLLKIFAISEAESVPTYLATDKMVEHRIDRIKEIRKNTIF